jgi:hypothetical protein
MLSQFIQYSSCSWAPATGPDAACAHAQTQLDFLTIEVGWRRKGRKTDAKTGLCMDCEERHEGTSMRNGQKTEGTGKPPVEIAEVLNVSLQANSRAVSRSIGELRASVSEMQCMWNC